MLVNGYEQFLVILLSTFLAIFLITGVILFSALIRVVRSVERITERAEHLVEKAENASEFLEHAAAQLTIGRFIGTLAAMLNRKKKQPKEGKT